MTYVSVDAIREWCIANKTREASIIGAARAHDVLGRIRASDEGSDNYSPRWASRYNLFKGMRENTSAAGVQWHCIVFASRLTLAASLPALYRRGHASILYFSQGFLPGTDA
jgi:hypothetical protein